MNAATRFAERLELQAPLAPLGVRGIAVAAAAHPQATPAKLLWLADVMADYAMQLAQLHLITQSADTVGAAVLLRLEAQAHADV